MANWGNQTIPKNKKLKRKLAKKREQKAAKFSQEKEVGEMGLTSRHGLG